MCAKSYLRYLIEYGGGESLKANNVAEFVADSKKLIGTEVEEWGQPGNPVITPSASVGFCNVTGDTNPLYRDPDYAFRTRYRCVTSTPTFLAAIRDPISQGAYSKKDYILANFLANVEFTWYDIIRVGERFDTELKTTSVSTKDAKVFGKPESKQIAYVEAKGAYRNQYGGLVGETESVTSMIPFKRGEEMFVDRELYQYSTEDALRIGKEIDSEYCRGMNTLYWDDVNIGDKLTPVVKGPLELGPLLSWFSATRTVDWHLENYYLRAKEAPGEARTNPVTNWPYWVEQLEYGSYHTSKLRGISYPFAPGMFQACLAGHLLTNWMSDEGFLRRLKIDINNVFMYGDVNWYKGEVTDKYREKIGDNTYGAVDVKIDVVNQIDEKVAAGEATVYLPFPGHGVALPIKLEARNKGEVM